MEQQKEVAWDATHSPYSYTALRVFCEGAFVRTERLYELRLGQKEDLETRYALVALKAEREIRFKRAFPALSESFEDVFKSLNRLPYHATPDFLDLEAIMLEYKRDLETKREAVYVQIEPQDKLSDPRCVKRART